MKDERTVLLDNEAVQALRDPKHRKHHRALAHVEANLGRRRRGASQRVLVPTTVRVEAGWSRSDPGAATLNRLGVVGDIPLDGTSADVAAGIVRRTGVGCADAHLGAAARALAGDVVVLTSDPKDIRRAAAPKRVNTIRV